MFLSGLNELGWRRWRVPPDGVHSSKRGQQQARICFNTLGLGAGMKMQLCLPRAKENNNLDSQGRNTWCHFAMSLLWSSLASPLGLGRPEHGGESGNEKKPMG